MIYRIKNGILHSITDNADWKQVPFFPANGQSISNPLNDRKFIVVQSTRSPLNSYGYAQWMQSPGSTSSVHLCIDTDGTIVQQVEFSVDAKQFGDEVQFAGNRNLDHITLNIAVVNPGPLERRADGGFGTWWGDYVDSKHVVEAAHPSDPTGNVVGWIPYTRAQVSAIMAFVKLIQFETKHMHTIGIDSIVPDTNKTPGPSLNKTFYDIVNTDIGKNK